MGLVGSGAPAIHAASEHEHPDDADAAAGTSPGQPAAGAVRVVGEA
jgi:hypothetical protein